MSVFIPVGVGGWKHELELYDAGAVTQLFVLDAVELIGNVSPADIHLCRGGRTAQH